MPNRVLMVLIWNKFFFLQYSLSLHRSLFNQYDYGTYDYLKWFCYCTHSFPFSYLIKIIFSKRFHLIGVILKIIKNLSCEPFKFFGISCEPCIKNVGKPFTRLSIWTLTSLRTKSNAACERLTNLYLLNCFLFFFLCSLKGRKWNGNAME